MDIFPRMGLFRLITTGKWRKPKEEEESEVRSIAHLPVYSVRVLQERYEDISRVLRTSEGEVVDPEALSRFVDSMGGLEQDLAKSVRSALELTVPVAFRGVVENLEAICRKEALIRDEAKHRDHPDNPPFVAEAHQRLIDGYLESLERDRINVCLILGQVFIIKAVDEKMEGVRSTFRATLRDASKSLERLGVLKESERTFRMEVLKDRQRAEFASAGLSRVVASVCPQLADLLKKSSEQFAERAAQLSGLLFARLGDSVLSAPEAAGERIALVLEGEREVVSALEGAQSIRSLELALAGEAVPEVRELNDELRELADLMDRVSGERGAGSPLLKLVGRSSSPSGRERGSTPSTPSSAVSALVALPERESFREAMKKAISRMGGSTPAAMDFVCALLKEGDSEADSSDVEFLLEQFTPNEALVARLASQKACSVSSLKRLLARVDESFQPSTLSLLFGHANAGASVCAALIDNKGDFLFRLIRHGGFFVALRALFICEPDVLERGLRLVFESCHNYPTFMQELFGRLEKESNLNAAIVRLILSNCFVQQHERYLDGALLSSCLRFLRGHSIFADQELASHVLDLFPPGSRWSIGRYVYVEWSKAQCALLKNPALSEQQMQKYMNDQGTARESYADALAENPSAPSDVLNNIAVSCSKEGQFIVLDHPHANEDTFAILQSVGKSPELKARALSKMTL